MAFTLPALEDLTRALTDLAKVEDAKDKSFFVATFAGLHCEKTEDWQDDGDEAALSMWIDGVPTAVNQYLDVPGPVAFVASLVADMHGLTTGTPTLAKQMTPGTTMPLLFAMPYTSSIRFLLIDEDSPGFPTFDDHDTLGDETIGPVPAQPGTIEGSLQFKRDGAHYVLRYTAYRAKTLLEGLIAEVEDAAGNAGAPTGGDEGGGGGGETEWPIAFPLSGAIRGAPIEHRAFTRDRLRSLVVESRRRPGAVRPVRPAR